MTRIQPNQSRKGQSRWRKCSLLLALAALFSVEGPSTVHAAAHSGMIVRVRLEDGSVERVQIHDGAQDSMTLSEIMKPFLKDSNDESCSLHLKNPKQSQSNPLDLSVSGSKLLSGVGLMHGSLITIQPNKESSIKKSKEQQGSGHRHFSRLTGSANKSTEGGKRWNPYPDLAKDYAQALLKTKARRSSSNAMSYGDIAHLQSSLHVVEPQADGPLKRVYMCSKSAERFHGNGISAPPRPSKKQRNPSPVVTPRVGLLLGTLQTERVDKDRSKRKARTSLSSQTEESRTCQIAKVHAIWEPSGQKSSLKVYDASMARQLLTKDTRVQRVATSLGLTPVGWIFSHSDAERQATNTNADDDGLPVWGLDVHTGATLQAKNMKKKQTIKEEEEDANKFVTLAMDGQSGATEAFQLSDAAIQMVHDGVLLVGSDSDDISSSDTNKSIKNSRHVKTRHGVLVDGKETKELDSVLCLVNTALLSHEGTFAGKNAASSVKKNGGLTIKTKKVLLKALGEDDRKLLEELCNFNTLLALDKTLGEEDSHIICSQVRKWARGQKEGTTLSSKLKNRLRSILES